MISVPFERNDEAAEMLSDLLPQGLENLRKIEADASPSDLLILVPQLSLVRHGDVGTDWVVVARQMCENAGLGYIDYTVREERKTPFSPEQVRICTYHSSRGIEGLYTVILGFDRIVEAAQGVNWKTCDLGHIVLSRSIYDTCIAYSLRAANSTPIRFLMGLLEIVGED